MSDNSFSRHKGTSSSRNRTTAARTGAGGSAATNPAARARGKGKHVASREASGKVWRDETVAAGHHLDLQRYTRARIHLTRCHARTLRTSARPQPVSLTVSRRGPAAAQTTTAHARHVDTTHTRRARPRPSSILRESARQRPACCRRSTHRGAAAPIEIANRTTQRQARGGCCRHDPHPRARVARARESSARALRAANRGEARLRATSPAPHARLATLAQHPTPSPRPHARGRRAPRGSPLLLSPVRRRCSHHTSTASAPSSAARGGASPAPPATTSARCGRPRARGGPRAAPPPRARLSACARMRRSGARP